MFNQPRQACEVSMIRGRVRISWLDEGMSGELEAVNVLYME